MHGAWSMPAPWPLLDHHPEAQRRQRRSLRTSSILRTHARVPNPDTTSQQKVRSRACTQAPASCRHYAVSARIDHLRQAVGPWKAPYRHGRLADGRAAQCSKLSAGSDRRGETRRKLARGRASGEASSASLLLQERTNVCASTPYAKARTRAAKRSPAKDTFESVRRRIYR